VALNVYTIGHSTRSFEEFLRLLQANGIELLADIRTIPRSARYPQFNRTELEAALAAAGLQYRHFKDLGGLRKPRPDSLNTAWRNPGFRGYADYMQTAQFAVAVDQLVSAARAQRTAVMCAEAVPWRCHRSLLADALLVRDVAVLDIMGPSAPKPRSLTPFAHVDGRLVDYPGVLDS
jgi:uncharacterized protein (DUF488 family)